MQPQGTVLCEGMMLRKDHAMPGDNTVPGTALHERTMLHTKKRLQKPVKMFCMLLTHATSMSGQSETRWIRSRLLLVLLGLRQRGKRGVFWDFVTGIISFAGYFRTYPVTLSREACHP